MIVDELNTPPLAQVCHSRYCRILLCYTVHMLTILWLFYAFTTVNLIISPYRLAEFWGILRISLIPIENLVKIDTTLEKRSPSEFNNTLAITLGKLN